MFCSKIIYRNLTNKPSYSYFLYCHPVYGVLPFNLLNFKYLVLQWCVSKTISQENHYFTFKNQNRVLPVQPSLYFW